MIRNLIHRGIEAVVRAVRSDDGEDWEWRGQYEDDDGRTQLVLPTYDYEAFDDADDALDAGESAVKDRIDTEMD